MTPTDASDTIQAASPVVSVIVPCYNYGRFLAGCVDSIFKSTSHPLEVIVIDDASTDETQAVTSNLARADARVRVFRHDVNWGHIATYNHGFSLVRGVYVHLISADDELAPGALDRAVAIMERHPEVGFVYGPVARRVGQDVPVLRSRRAASYGIMRGADWIAARCQDGRNPVLSPEVTVRQSVALAAGDYDARLPDLADLEMWLRLAARSDVGVVQDADQAIYRIHGGNMNLASSRRDNVAQRYRQRLLAFELFLERDGGLVGNPEELVARVRRRIAGDLVAHTRRQFDGTDESRSQLREALAAARAMTGGAVGVPGWKRAHRIAERSPAPMVPALRSLAHRAVGWWRWQIESRDLGQRGVRIAFRGTLTPEQKPERAA
jgi:glycosyltransferase involved in cell wall biosynthesis